jgi:hypothetical protein
VEVTLFVLLAVGILALEHFMLVWLQPENATAVALHQLDPRSAAAQTLRMYEFLKGVTTTATGSLIVMVGLLCFGGYLRGLFGRLLQNR